MQGTQKGQNRLEKEKGLKTHILTSKCTTKLESSMMSDTGVRIDTDQWSKTESPEINSYIYGQMLFNKNAKTIQRTGGKNRPFKCSISRYIPKRLENICPQKTLYTNFHSCINANRQKVERNSEVHQPVNG